MTIPNLITMIRIILTPIFIIYMINDKFLYALILFLICSITDGIDGMIARFFNQKSNLGAYLYPLADKLLLVSAFVTLAVKNIMPAWLTVMVIARDVMILLGICILLLNRLDFKIKPSMISKINTCFQFLLLIFYLSKSDFLHYPIIRYLEPALVIPTAILTISSGLHYMYLWFKILGGDGLMGSDFKKSDDTGHSEQP
jgi:cardiolipin synthase